MKLLLYNRCMVFSSLVFLFAFFPVVMLGYYILPANVQLYWLLVANLAFYGWGEPVYILLMLLSIAINYGAAMMLSSSRREAKRRKIILAVCVILNISLLGWFKYANFIYNNLALIFPSLRNFTPPNIPLPVGISFYTFQALSYIIDVYRKDCEAQRNPLIFGVYISLFPQLIAGPIVKYREVAAEIKSRIITPVMINEGLKRFIIGLAKKLLLANSIGQLWDAVSANGSPGLFGAWVGVAAFSFQIYFDFSGYSDMAIGMGKMLGFHFLENFEYPYTSRSITEFWRRWHISLSSCFRSYVYIPLGGSRKGFGRQAVNIFTVWLLTGLWHGAAWNFVLWGLFFAILLINEKLWLKEYLDAAPSLAGHFYTMFAVGVSWVIFAFTDFSKMTSYISYMFVWNSEIGAFSLKSLRYSISYIPLLLICAVGSTRLPAILWGMYYPKNSAAIADMAAFILFILCVAAVTTQSYNPFIYFRF